MGDLFLESVGVRTEASAMTETLKSALGRNKVYSREEVGNERSDFRGDWAKLLRQASRHYAQPVSDADHCSAIRTISDGLSNSRYRAILVNGRLRYGTSQKALNLYLKYLCRLGIITTPPHCPVDSIVLAAGDVDGAWTKCDSEKEYMQWINRLRWKARPLTLAEWELRMWKPTAA